MAEQPATSPSPSLGPHDYLLTFVRFWSHMTRYHTYDCFYFAAGMLCTDAWPQFTCFALAVRPLIARELLLQNDGICVSVPDPRAGQVVIGSRSFAFDSAFSPEASQEVVYDASVPPLLDAFTKGYNVTILAYGQTGELVDL